MSVIIFAIVSMGITILVTAVLCRIRIAQKRKVSYGTMILGITIVAIFLLVFVSRGDCFSLSFWASLHVSTWTRIGSARVLILRLVALTTVASILPAFGVVHYYQKLNLTHQP